MLNPAFQRHDSTLIVGSGHALILPLCPYRAVRAVCVSALRLPADFLVSEFAVSACVRLPLLCFPPSLRTIYILYYHKSTLFSLIFIIIQSLWVADSRAIRATIGKIIRGVSKKTWGDKRDKNQANLDNQISRVSIRISIFVLLLRIKVTS